MAKALQDGGDVTIQRLAADFEFLAGDILVLLLD